MIETDYFYNASPRFPVVGLITEEKRHYDTFLGAAADLLADTMTHEPRHDPRPMPRTHLHRGDVMLYNVLCDTTRFEDVHFNDLVMSIHLDN